MVCKTVIRGFDSRLRLHLNPLKKRWLWYFFANWTIAPELTKAHLYSESKRKVDFEAG